MAEWLIADVPLFKHPSPAWMLLVSGARLVSLRLHDAIVLAEVLVVSSGPQMGCVFYFGPPRIQNLTSQVPSSAEWPFRCPWLASYDRLVRDRWGNEEAVKSQWRTRQGPTPDGEEANPP